MQQDFYLFMLHRQEVRYKNAGNGTQKKKTTDRLPLKPHHPLQLVLGIGGVVSGGRALVPGTVIDCGAETSALDPQAAAAQGSR
jgi:hypothetical protein